MLHQHTVADGILELLTQIMAVPELVGFNLAGGTSLALQIGHRVSFDLDLFGDRPFSETEIIGLLEEFARVTPLQITKNILILNVNGVKVDFVNYKYALLNPVLREGNLRLITLPDIAAMKLAAITGRGKKRDFTDLYFLLKEFSLAEIMGFYSKKYPDSNEWLVARSLAYFEDAEQDEAPQLFKPADWTTVKKTIESAVRKRFR